VLFTPERHEALTDLGFSEQRARDAIARIAARAGNEFDAADGRWPLDPEDAIREDEGPASGLYCGAAGIYWALGELADEGYDVPDVVERERLEALEPLLVEEPDDDWGLGGVWSGIPGVLAVAEHRWPDAARRDRLAGFAHDSLTSRALEVMYGHPGHMLLAAQLHARTGEDRWRDLCTAGAERLLREWRRDDELDAWLWTQRLGQHETQYLGAAHGVVGTAQALLHEADTHHEVERRTVETMSRLAVIEQGRANWPPGAGEPLEQRGRIRVQWCHGAPGVLITLWNTARDDDVWNELLLAAGRLVWDAGPIRDDAGLCHGTAGNAYALLALWRRTGDEQWLERARSFAQHAALQVEQRVDRVGRGWHSLYTGDEGVAICLASCLAGDARMPIAERLVT
jgi:hypothetical protein